MRLHRIQPRVERLRHERLARFRGGLRFPLVLAAASLAGVDLSANLVSNLNSQATHAGIQEAVNAAQPGDTLFLFPGTYTEGDGIVVDRDLTLYGQHASNTIVQAASVPGAASNRVFLVEDAHVTLEGLTIRHGWTGGYGGGVYATSAATGVLSRCVLAANTADHLGGGAFDCTLNDCLIEANTSASSGGGVFGCRLTRCMLAANRAMDAGGASSSTLDACALTGNVASRSGGAAGTQTVLRHCTVTGNHANWAGGGVAGCLVTNSIVYYNTATLGFNLWVSSAAYSCSDVDPGGVGNLVADPQLASALRLSSSSPCLGQANPLYTSGTDLDGEPWAAPPSMGCDEPVVGGVTGDLAAAASIDYSRFATTHAPDLRAAVEGRASRTAWDFGDGTSVSNRPFARRHWESPGTYDVVLTAWNDTHPEGVSATATVEVVEQPVHHAVSHHTGAAEPYGSWATAASNIQDAVDAADVPGALVLVSNGVYAAGGRAVEGGLTNRVAATMPIEVRSLGGPEATVILGEGPLGETAVRCAYVGDHALLVGFTLSNGHTRAAGETAATQGGGVLCEPSGRLYNCRLVGNEAAQAGGVANGIVERSVISDNRANGGGGAARTLLLNCLLSGNTAQQGGGAMTAMLQNCTVVDNMAYQGGGVMYCSAANSIIYYNGQPPDGWGEENHYGTPMHHCCTTPLPDPAYYGGPNLESPPGFVRRYVGDYHPAASSPCVDWGTNAFVAGTSDLDGFARIVGPAVDLGAYEYVDSDGDGLPDYWEIRYDLRADEDGTLEPEHGPSGDPDGDGATNLDEFRHGTDPRNRASAFTLREVEMEPGSVACRITVGTEPGWTYTVEFKDGYPDPGLEQWHSFRDSQYGTWQETNSLPSEHTFVDDTSYWTTTRPPLFGRRQYRVVQSPSP